MCGEYTDDIRSHHHPGAQFWVGSNLNWSFFLEEPNTGRHEKAPVRCQCSRLAALHGAPRTLEWCCKPKKKQKMSDHQLLPYCQHVHSEKAWRALDGVVNKTVVSKASYFVSSSYFYRKTNKSFGLTGSDAITFFLTSIHY